MKKRFTWVFAGLMGFAVSALSAPLPDTIARIKPAIVGIATFLPTRRPPTRLVGTGFAIGGGRYIGTNAHVVDLELDAREKERLVVLAGTGNRPEMLAATLAAEDRDHDVAILRIDRRLPPLTLDTGRAREGEVFAFTGYPIGAILGLYPVTHRGMVSSVTPMAIPAPSASRLSVKKILRLRDPVMVYQLDATAYPGNSGSPLYRPDDGAVVGILNQVYVKSTKEDVLSDPSGISYAVPVKHLKALLDTLPAK